MANLANRVDHALTLENPDDAVQKIKEAVLEDLQRLDPALDEITILGNFNHSYRPDFILNWGTGRGKRARPIFLRLVAGGRSTQLDVDTLESSRPIFLGLMNHRVERGEPDLSIENDTDADSATNDRVDIDGVEAGAALISDVSALDELEVAGARAVPTVATSALVRAGSGVLGMPEAETLRSSVADAYDAALNGRDPAEVDAGADALRSFLDPPDAERVDLQFDLLWLAGGGDIEKLENGHRLLHADLSRDEWTLVLAQFLARPEPSDKALWRLLGSRMSLEDVAVALSRVRDPLHVDDFVTANEKVWKARYAGAIRHADAELKGWWVTDRTLALGTGKLSIAVTSLKSKADSLGTDLGRQSFGRLRSVIANDRMLSLDARDGQTSIRLSGDDALPTDRVNQVVSWTDQVEGLSVETEIGGDAVTLEISYTQGRVRSNKEVPIGQFARRAATYLQLPESRRDVS